jgi:hypothetical protein
MTGRSGTRNRGYPARSGYDREPGDFYAEPHWAVNQLLDSLDAWGEPLQGEVLDPCCGSGTIVSALLDRGLQARGSDIVDRGFGEVRDLFTITQQVDNIVSNVPYKLAERCVRHMLTLVRYRLILILRIAFWESRRRHALFREHPPVWWAPCSNRPSMPPGIIGNLRDHNGAFIQPPSKGGTAPYGWFAWQPGYRGRTETRLMVLRTLNRGRPPPRESTTARPEVAKKQGPSR